MMYDSDKEISPLLSGVLDGSWKSVVARLTTVSPSIELLRDEPGVRLEGSKLIVMQYTFLGQNDSLSALTLFFSFAISAFFRNFFSLSFAFSFSAFSLAFTSAFANFIFSFSVLRISSRRSSTAPVATS